MRFAFPLAALLVAGCVTPRMYPQEQISTLTRSCGLALGEVFQDEMEPRLLFLISPDPSRAQIACVGKWARKRRLHVAYVDAVVTEAP